MADTALDALVSMFAQYGLANLATAVGKLAGDPAMTDAEKYAAVYNLPEYKQRFPAMAEMQKKGIVETEGQYINQEQSYLNVLKAAGLPQGFYDSHDALGQFMTNAVSPDEVASRIRRGQQILDSSDPSLRKAALDYYGLDNDHLLAHLLDPNAAAPLIDKQLKAVSAGAAAQRNNIALDKQQAESLASDPYASGLFNNPYNPNAINDAFAKANAMSIQDTRLSAIEGQTYNQQDAISANLRNDYGKQLESQKRAEREAARFSGSSGTTSGSIGSQSGL
jgi:2-hydroxychromene-2-carboxylate isomerase